VLRSDDSSEGGIHFIGSAFTPNQRTGVGLERRRHPTVSGQGGDFWAWYEMGLVVLLQSTEGIRKGNKASPTVKASCLGWGRGVGGGGGGGGGGRGGEKKKA